LRFGGITVIGAFLIATVGWEIDSAHEPDPAPGAAPPARHAAASPKPAAPAAEDQAGRWAATALARPLFSPDRRPSTDIIAAGDLPLKLQGTIVVPPARVAIFAPPGGGKSVVVHERDRMGALGIDEIRPGEVAATGPSGQVVFRLGSGSAVERPAFQPPTLSHSQGGNDQHTE